MMEDPIADPDELPPRLPETLEELDEARALLGLQAGKRLKSQGVSRLRQLVGCEPTKKQAANWKRTLKTYRDELLGELGAADLP